MENKNKDDLFRFVEYSPEAAERTGYSDYSYWKSVFQNFFKKKSAVIMSCVFFALVIFSFVALWIGKYEYAALETNSALAFQKPNMAWSEPRQGVDSKSPVKSSGLERITLAVTTGVRYGMQLRLLSSWH